MGRWQPSQAHAGTTVVLAGHLDRIELGTYAASCVLLVLSIAPRRCRWRWRRACRRRPTSRRRPHPGWTTSWPGSRPRSRAAAARSGGGAAAPRPTSRPATRARPRAPTARRASARRAPPGGTCSWAGAPAWSRCRPWRHVSCLCITSSLEHRGSVVAAVDLCTC